MRSYALLAAGMAGAFLALFAVVQAFDLPLLADPTPWLAGGAATAAALGVALLILDVFLPVPSSLVMVAHGALFGVAAGTLLSLAGGLGAGALGFALGRWGSPLLLARVAADERRRADALLDRWGALAVVVTRPVPILAETVAILAGTTPLGWPRFLLATTAGTLPAALLYAATGATAARLDHTILVFVLVLLVAGAFWWLGRRRGRRQGSSEERIRTPG
ncbi:MAG TPA: VTT domain-containing protein [Thermoanaerobaculia bacterium]|nr:VTT domain-containing protein [Thermoanaerobaculia bacterium]